MAVKQSFTARCDGDGCRSYEDVESGERLPVDWMRVTLVDDLGRLQKTNTFDFCSLKCVERWAKARAVALGLTGSGRKAIERNKKCPYCEELFTPQGLTLHINTTHPDEKLLDEQTKPQAVA